MNLFLKVFFLSILSFPATALEPLNNKQGYLLVAFRVENGYLPYQVTLTGDGFLNDIRIDSIKPYNNFRLFAVKAGTYSWKSVLFTKSIYLDADFENYEIKVEAGKINYGGTLSIYSEMNRRQNSMLGGAFLNFNNKSSRALFFLEKEHSELLKKYPLIYTGEQKDQFFEYVRNMENKL